MAKKILVLYPRPLDYHHLLSLNSSGQYEFDFQSFGLDDIVRQGYAPDDTSIMSVDDIIAEFISHASDHEGIIGTHDYPGTLLAALYALHRGLPFTSVESVLLCQHKYYFREHLQMDVPEATPEFHLLNDEVALDDFSFPLFIKPVKSSFSRYAQVVDTVESLKDILKQGPFTPSYLNIFNEVFAEYMGFTANANSYIAEGVLVGEQVSLEGYVYQGIVTILGIIDSHFYEGTLSFEAFTYPSTLPESIQQRMATIAKKAVSSLELNNTLFSVEMMYNPEDNVISIIEINPRISSQFADFFEHVHGVNTYEILLALTLGSEPPQLATGRYTHAGSFPLRFFEDKKVLTVPSQEEVTQLRALFPDLLLHFSVQEGQSLSQLQQDGNSFLYAVLNIAANSFEELNEKKQQITAFLPFEFEEQ